MKVKKISSLKLVLYLVVCTVIILGMMSLRVGFLCRVGFLLKGHFKKYD